MAHKPLFLLIPGNFLPPSYYTQTSTLLTTHNFRTRTLPLPSTGSPTLLPSNASDIAAVRAVLSEELVSEPGVEIIVVAHSYGGIVACEAVKGLGYQERLDEGKWGGVVRLVFVAAWLLQEGESAPEVIARYAMEAPWARFEGGNVFADDPLFAFHNDTSAETAASWAPYTTHSDLAALSTPLEYAAWRHIPSTYVVCELDRCILPHVQEGMIKATGGKVKVRRLRSGHMPMLSVPEALVDVLRGVGGWVGCVGG